MFQDIKDQIIDRINSLWDEIQESPTFNNLRERYEHLTPNKQKGLLFGAIFVVCLILLMMPLSYFESASDNITYYEENRSVIRELLHISRMGHTPSALPQQVSVPNLINQYRSELSRFNLIPKQIKELTPIDLSDRKSKMAPDSITQKGFAITLAQINLQQILDISYELAKINVNVKVMGIDVKRNTTQKENYYDVVYKMISFSVPEETDKKSKQKPDKKSKQKNEGR